MRLLPGSPIFTLRGQPFAGAFALIFSMIFAGPVAHAVRCESLFVRERIHQTQPSEALIQSLADLFLDIEGRAEGATRRRLQDDYQQRSEWVSRQYGPKGMALLAKEIARRRDLGRGTNDEQRLEQERNKLIQKQGDELLRLTRKRQSTVKGTFADFLNSQQMVVLNNGMIKVFDFTVGKEVFQITGDVTVADQLKMNPDRKSGLLFGGSGIFLVDFVGRKMEKIADPLPAWIGAWDHVSRSANGEMNLVITRAGFHLFRFDGRTLAGIPIPSAFSFDRMAKYDLSPDGHVIARTQEKGNPQVLDVGTGEVRELAVPSGVLHPNLQNLLISPDSKSVWFRASNTDWFEFDVATGKILRSNQVAFKQYSPKVVFTEDRSWVVEYSDSVQLRTTAFSILDTLTGQLRTVDWPYGDPSHLGPIVVDRQHNRIVMAEQIFSDKFGYNELRRYFIYDIASGMVEAFEQPPEGVQRGHMILSPEADVIFDSSDFEQTY